MVGKTCQAVFNPHVKVDWTGGSVVGSGIRVPFLMRWRIFFNLPNPSSRIIVPALIDSASNTNE
jgi:hypothetical protein